MKRLLAFFYIITFISASSAFAQEQNLAFEGHFKSEITGWKQYFEPSNWQVKEGCLTAAGKNLTVAIAAHVEDCSDTFSNPHESIQHLAMDSDHCIFGEPHFWVRGGQITANPSLKNVFGVGNFYSPPFAAHCQLEIFISGRSVALERYEWRPSEVWRSGRSGDLRVETLLTPAVDRRGFLLTARVINEGAHEAIVPINLTMKGKLNRIQVWHFRPPVAKEPLVPARDSNDLRDNRLLLENNQGGVAVVADLPGIARAEDKTTLTGNLTLAPGQSTEFNVALVVGTAKEATMAADELLAKPTAQITASRRYWANQIEKLYTRMPRLISDNRQLVDLSRIASNIPEVAAKSAAVNAARGIVG